MNLSEKIELKKYTSQIAEVAKQLVIKGWAERNAGNISINITSLIDEKHKNSISNHNLDIECPELIGNTILISASGARMREIAINPLNYLCVVYIDSASSYQILFNGRHNELIPSSEIDTHLLIHNYIIKNNIDKKVLLHCHATELIAVTHNSKINSSESLSDLLFSMHPELIMFAPEGIAFVPYMMPGTKQIAEKTTELLTNKRILVWEKHGCISLGDDLWDAYEMIESAAKAANIFFMASSSGYKPEGLKKTELEELKAKFGSIQ